MVVGVDAWIYCSAKRAPVAVNLIPFQTGQASSY